MSSAPSASWFTVWSDGTSRHCHFRCMCSALCLWDILTPWYTNQRLKDSCKYCPRSHSYKVEENLTQLITHLQGRDWLEKFIRKKYCIKKLRAATCLKFSCMDLWNISMIAIITVDTSDSLQYGLLCLYCLSHLCSSIMPPNATVAEFKQESLEDKHRILYLYAFGA